VIDTLQPIVSIQPHQFVGYWGYGDESALENQLSQILNQTLMDSPQPLRRRRIASNKSAHSDSCWGVAYAGLGHTVSSFNQSGPLLSSTPIELIAALSASGLWSSQSPDGTLLPDAWVKAQDKCLMLGREPFGRVPLYWTQSGQVIWFASRLNLLLPLVESTQISIPALYGYSCFSYVPTSLTPIETIFSVPAGTEERWVKNESGTLTRTNCRSLQWQEFPNQLQDEATAIDHLQTLLKNAVYSQVGDLDDEPVGIFLSGGLDSSIVAALLVQAGLKVRAYTLDFGTAGIPEYPYAEQVAQFLNIPLVKVDATPRRIRRALLPTAQALDLPFGDGVSVPLYLLCQAASQETRVIFNGEGGDQLFAGWTNKPLIAASVYQAKHPVGETFEQQYLRTFHRLWGYEASLFQPDVVAHIKAINPQDWLQDALQPTSNSYLLHRLRRANLLLKGAQNIHPRATSLGFVQGLKVRSPFCNLALAQATFHIAPELYLQGSCEKYILKRAVESWLPSEIIWRPKRGMGVPLTSWCLNELWPELGAWLNPARLKEEGLWDPYLAVRITAGELGTIQNRRIGECLWLLLMWQVWRQVTLGKPGHGLSLNHPFWLPSWLGRHYLQFRRRSKEW